MIRKSFFAGKRWLIFVRLLCYNGIASLYTEAFSEGVLFMGHCYYYEYLPMNGEDFFTIVLLPKVDGRFPVVVCRTPYVKSTVHMSEDEILW